MRLNETTEINEEDQQALEIGQLYDAVRRVAEAELVLSAAKQQTVILRGELIRKYGYQEALSMYRTAKELLEDSDEFVKQETAE